LVIIPFDLTTYLIIRRNDIIHWSHAGHSRQHIRIYLKKRVTLSGVVIYGERLAGKPREYVSGTCKTHGA
jgi:hypothetical protein